MREELIPSSMILRDTWYEHLQQWWKNIAAVLDTLDGGSLRDIFGSLIDVATNFRGEEKDISKKETYTAESVATNASVLPGKIDSLPHTTSLSDLYGGYEDEST